MSRQKTKTLAYYPSNDVCCGESVQNVKDYKKRYKENKRILKQITDLALRDNAFDYEDRAKIIGRAYQNMIETRSEYYRIKERLKTAK